MTGEDRVKQNTARIIMLESDVGSLKVDTGKLNLKLDHQEERQEDRFKVLATAQIDLKDIMKARQEADEKRAEEARKYRADREKQEHDANLAKQKWVQSLLTPQTMLLIIVILASIFGVKGIDMLEAATGAVQPAVTQP
jgi:septal ring factor EnvC (AmiA/AmiB activator)